MAGDNTKVNFVDTANNAVVLQAPYLSVNGYTNGVQTITATTPGIVQDSTYYVTVTTFPAGGTSATGPIFTYVPLTPVVASVNPTSGGSGTSITVTGIGFVSGGTTVQLVPTGNGSTLNATNVTVSASTTLTATVPSGGQNNATYYVEITTTTGGASCPNSGCGSVVRHPSTPTRSAPPAPSERTPWFAALGLRSAERPCTPRTPAEWTLATRYGDGAAS